MNAPKVYVFANSKSGNYDVGALNVGIEYMGDVTAVALAEDGHYLAAHFSSSIGWAQHDMGLTSDWKHDIYRKHYPEGYELEWVDDPQTHPGLQAAVKAAEELEELDAKLAASSSE